RLALTRESCADKNHNASRETRSARRSDSPGRTRFVFMFGYCAGGSGGVASIARAESAAASGVSKSPAASFAAAESITSVSTSGVCLTAASSAASSLVGVNVSESLTALDEEESAERAAFDAVPALVCVSWGGVPSGLTCIRGSRISGLGVDVHGLPQVL